MAAPIPRDAPVTSRIAGMVSLEFDFGSAISRELQTNTRKTGEPGVLEDMHCGAACAITPCPPSDERSARPQMHHEADTTARPMARTSNTFCAHGIIAGLR